MNLVYTEEEKLGLKEIGDQPMNLYDQLRALQTIDHAYSEWAQYRKDLTSILIQYAKGSKRIALFGAGRCNDIDLNRLLEVFEEIILIDKDLEAMQEGIKQQNVIKTSSIQLQKADFVGIEEHDYRLYAERLVKEIRRKGMATRADEVAEIALEQLEQLFQKAMHTPLCFEDLSYDTAIVIGVHSQLLSMLEWIWSVILQTIQQDEMRVRNYIIKMNRIFVTRLNEAIIRGAKHRIIMGCEKSRVGRKGTVQGAIQALIDLQKQQEEGKLELCESTMLSWPFHKAQSITYEMLIQSLDKNEGR